MLEQLQRELHSLANPVRAKISANFFKTAPGQYGHGDIFLGLTVPQQRIIAKKYSHVTLTDISKLLHSKYHEARLVGTFLLVHAFEKGDEKQRDQIVQFYLQHAQRFNNWDLVDSSAYQILGTHLLKKSKSILIKLARSKNLWERRIAIIATYAMIRAGKSIETFRVAALLLKDEHDLIHKASGWMLREAGKRCSRTALESFLKKYYAAMPRTMLRYAIEHFPKSVRRKYLAGKI